MNEENRKTSNAGSGKIHLIALAVLVVIVSGLLIDVSKAESDNFYSDFLRLDNVAKNLHQKYVEEVKSSDLVDKAIDGMLKILDPHSTFFREKEYEELRIHTEGKFGGLGIQISIRDNVLTVMTPISGTPASRAGIRSGDQIIKIDGKSTKGITIDEAVGKLRGEPGTEVKIAIRRKGENQDLDYTLTRAVITIKSVPYYGVINGNVGYIRLVTFSQDAAEQVSNAIKELMAKKVTGMVFDLRHNPGGLLPQAIDVSSLFLDKKCLVVSTRGRVAGQNKDYHARSNPVLPPDIPLVVLVNAASASASEIVAGAIQDWDRGLVIGDTTFGKGSVQTILPIDEEHHLKLTTAFYYTPSGRCINKPENAIRGNKKTDESSVENNGDEPTDDTDSAVTDTSVVSRDTTTYRTKSGRIVYGGGGIIPDSIIEPGWFTAPVMSLLSKDVFFKFANVIYPGLKKKKTTIDTNLVIDESMMKSFYAFFDTIDYNYKSFAKIKFEEFKQKAGLADTAKKDSSTLARYQEPHWDDQQLKQIVRLTAAMDSMLTEESQRGMHENEAEIRKQLKNALLVRELGQDDPVMYRLALQDDVQVQEAITLMKNRKAYDELLKPRTIAKQ